MSDISERFLKDHPLANYCTFQIGGPADYFFEANSVAELVEAVEWAEGNDVPYFVFGGGSNLLFDDAGFRGLVIRMRGQEIELNGDEITADAGVMSAVLVQKAYEAGLSGLECWSGLPGTVGGAVYGNAGCFGVETKDVLKSALVYFPGEGPKEVGAKFFEYGYRHSRLKEEPGTVLRATFGLSKGDSAEIKEKMQEIARARMGKQPAGLNTGSFFKNPSTEQPAGMLIDQCGLKGAAVGKAQISEQHANFFMNKGGATAQDILDLAKKAEDAVREKFGIELEREVVFVPAE